jgi:membrane-associated PAP2 superfamily phosphatase
VHLGVPLLLALVLLAVFETSNLDRWISDFYFDPALPGFPLRRDWFLETVMHRWTKYPLILLALALLGGWLASFRFAALRTQRRVLLFLVLAMGLGPAAVGGLKQVTGKHCPYDLDRYGGAAPYTRLLEAAPEGVKPGACWPGGHASGGFGLLGFYFIWYRRRPRRADAALAIALVYGFAMGWGRLMQGAHFLSHNLWAALVCWLVALLLYRLMLRPNVAPDGAVSERELSAT